MSANVVEFEELRQRRLERDVYNRWCNFYREQPYEELLESLIYEHENQFPMRTSDSLMDQLKHKALVQTLDNKAQTKFLKSFLEEIR
jgi:hypothetical protein